MMEEFLFVKKKKYAKKIFKKFGMFGYKSMIALFVCNEKLVKEYGTKKVVETLYRRLLGNLLHFTITKLDIMFSSNLPSRFMNSPSQFHFSVGKRVSRFIQGTRSYGIRFERNP